MFFIFYLKLVRQNCPKYLNVACHIIVEWLVIQPNKMVGKEEVNLETLKRPNLDISMHKIVYLNYIIIGFLSIASK